MNDPPIGDVTISGTSQEDETLTASDTLVDADGMGTVNHQWQRSNSENGPFTNIPGATDGTYGLGDDDVGQVVRVLASYVDGQGVFESKHSTPTTIVSNVNDNPAGILSIIGDAREDKLLNVDNSISDADGETPTVTFSFVNLTFSSCKPKPKKIDHISSPI